MGTEAFKLKKGAKALLNIMKVVYMTLLYLMSPEVMMQYLFVRNGLTFNSDLNLRIRSVPFVNETLRLVW